MGVFKGNAKVKISFLISKFIFNIYIIQFACLLNLSTESTWLFLFKYITSKYSP